MKKATPFSKKLEIKFRMFFMCFFVYSTDLVPYQFSSFLSKIYKKGCIFPHIVI